MQNTHLIKKLLILQNTIMHYRKALYNDLSKHYDVTVLHSGPSSVEPNDLYREIIVPKRSFGPFTFQSGVLKAVREDGYDAIVAMFDVRWINNALAVFFNRKARFLYWGHRYSRNIVINKIRDRLMRKADGVILYGDSEIERMVSRGMPATKIFVAPNTLYVSNHSDCSHEEKHSLLFVGRAQKRKKVDELIRAFAEVLHRIPENVTVDIVGSGEENEDLKRLSKQLNVFSRVIFHGKIVDHVSLKPFFEKAFAYVSPGPVGLGVLHSFAYGVPVVTHVPERHGPEFDNVEDGKDALLYHTYDELKEIIIRLCNDRNLSSYLGRNAYELYSKKRSLNEMVKGFLSALEGTKAVN